MNALYLASQSPRRFELLHQIGFEPRVLLPDPPVDEAPFGDEPVRSYVIRLARAKAEAGEVTRQARGLPSRPLLAADTTVTLDGQILGKPQSAVEAREWLRRFSGRTHSVLTAVCVIRDGVLRETVSESEVRFRALEETEIAAYIASGEPFDKAGGYGIQGRAAAFISSVSGSYSGVMGLPLCETAQLLRQFGLEVA